MRRLLALLSALVLTLVSLTAFGGDLGQPVRAGAGPVQTAWVVLKKQPGYSTNGFVLLEQVKPNSVRFTFLLSAFPPSGGHPAHVHKALKGAQCNAGAVMTDLTPLKSRANNTVSTSKVVTGTINSMLKAGGVVVVHDTDGKYMACGKIVFS